MPLQNKLEKIQQDGLLLMNCWEMAGTAKEVRLLSLSIQNIAETCCWHHQAGTAQFMGADITAIKWPDIQK